MDNDKITYNQICENLHGKSLKKQKAKKSIQGLLKNWKKENIESLIKNMIFEGILFEKLTQLKMANSYLYLNVDQKRLNHFK